jgi:hypothetical protein
MNDLQTLHDAWAPPEPPSPIAYTDARAKLLARASAPPPRRRRRAPFAIRFAAFATVGAVVATFVLVVQNLGDSPPGVSIASADQVLEQAARAAERKPFTPPRDDQWIYTADKFTSSDGGKPFVRRAWHRVSGIGFAVQDDDGKLQVIDPPKQPGRDGRPAPFDDYKALAALRRDPDALLRWAYEQAKNVEGAGLTEDGDVYAIFSGALGRNVLPPELEAAIFRALKRVPGVTVETITVLGHRVLSLAQTEDWLREELFLDPETYAYRGERGTVVHDAVINPEKAGNATGEIEKGHTATSVRLTTAIVDKPGQRSR